MYGCPAHRSTSRAACSGVCALTLIDPRQRPCQLYLSSQTSASQSLWVDFSTCSACGSCASHIGSSVAMLTPASSSNCLAAKSGSLPATPPLGGAASRRSDIVLYESGVSQKCGTGLTAFPVGQILSTHSAGA